MTDDAIHQAGPSRRHLLLAAAALAAPGARAQGAASFPTRAVRLVVPSPPGSLADIIARLFSPGMGEELKQSVVVDNRPGAAGALAADVVAKSPPDGYNLLLATDSLLTINPFIYPSLSYDSRRDFQPVSLFGKASVVLVVSPALGVKTLREFIALAKSRPGTLNYGSGGNGHTTHLAMELLLNRADLKITHVPYRGTAPAVQALMAGEVGAVITGVGEVAGHIKAGKVLVLASSGPVGKTLFPDVPEMKEIHPDLDLAFWFGLLAPAKTPRPIVTQLHAAVTRATSQPEVRQRLGDFGLTPMSATPEVVEGMIVADLAKYGPLVRALGIKAE
jgi:tripartite-type tricarboxylate transporter receptor subunit TctC